MFAKPESPEGHDRLAAATAPRPGRLGRTRRCVVMFTDIVGFTRLAEALPPTLVARLLRGHFRLLARCIGAEHGRIDKVMGDGLIAIWDGAGGAGRDCAAALRAALAVRGVVATDNAWRRRHGLPELRLRIGVHAGPLVATSLGRAPGLGTLLCGDTVNVAQRLEDAARALVGETEVAILASEAVLAAAGGGFAFREVGRLAVRGRTEPVTACALEASGPGAAPSDGARGGS